MLSKRMKRITLLMYIIRTEKNSPAITRIEMRAVRTTGSIFGKPDATRWREEPSCCGRVKLEGKLTPPPELVSPASKPTRASLLHCQKRNGCTSCRFVCWKAREIVSVAEIGTRHLGNGSGYSE